MAVDSPGQDVGHIKSTADLSATANQYRAVKIAAGEWVLCTAGDAGYILQDLPKAANPARVRLTGITRVRADPLSP